MRWKVALRRFDCARKFRRRHAGQRVPRDTLYYLHIGKTSGTFLCTISTDAQGFLHEPMLLVPFEHTIKHPHLPAASHFVFGTRDPITRFVSGFYGRKRLSPMGRNRQTPEEAQVFSRFRTPNALAEALDGATQETRAAALDAMAAICDVNTFQSDWFTDRDRLAADITAGRAHRVRHEALSSDLRAMFSATGFELAPDRIEDRPRAHTASNSEDKHLSARALDNLKVHYARDIAFLAWLDEQGLRGASAV